MNNTKRARLNNDRNLFEAVREIDESLSEGTMDARFAVSAVFLSAPRDAAERFVHV
jgi:hypothetical protein